MPHWDLSQLAPPLSGAMEFLRDHLPLSDLDTYPLSYFLSCARHACMVRARFPWCAELEEELFYHYVLCPRVNDEDLSDHRALFFSQLWPLVEGLSVEDAVLAVNRWCHRWASYELQDDRTASPLTVFRSGSGRCGEESAFLTAALRSVGIAARQVYSPRWAHCDDNHAWVEALCGGRWRFLGACEPEPVLDRGWFNAAAGRALLVHSRTFGRGSSPLHGPLLEQEGAVCWYNQTARYARTHTCTLQVLHGGRPVSGAQVQIQVLNEAAYHTVLTLATGEDGTASAELGLGDFHVEARWNGLEAECNCAGGSQTLELAPPDICDGGWEDFDVHAPQGLEALPPPLSEDEKHRRMAVLLSGTRVRRARMKDRYHPELAAQLPSCESLLQKSRGNFAELFRFLSGPERKEREALVCTLSEKDLRDVTCAVLEDHLLHRPPQPDDLDDLHYWDCVCSPRIGLEPLTPWREVLSEMWTPSERAQVLAGPRAVVPLLAQRVKKEAGRIYANLSWPPLAALEAGRCDSRSFDLLCTAQLRALGIPAYLRALDGKPVFGHDRTFQPLEPEESARLTLTRGAEDSFRYGQNWSLSRRTPGGWTRLHLPDGGWAGRARTLAFSLPAGVYRLITAVRLPNGNQLAARNTFPLAPGAEVRIPMRLRAFSLEDLLIEVPLPPVPAVAWSGEAIPDAVHTGRPALLIWLEEGGEPTEHVLHELLEAQGVLSALPVEVRFFLRSREAVRHPALARLLERWPQAQVLLDDWGFDVEHLSRRLGLDPDRPPLCVVCGGDGLARYGVSGYRVGSVELLGRICKRLF